MYLRRRTRGLLKKHLGLTCMLCSCCFLCVVFGMLKEDERGFSIGIISFFIFLKSLMNGIRVIIIKLKLVIVGIMNGNA